jgi:hypothetical protein
MPMNAMTNGRVRKSLAEQIDRLDRTLDGLAEGLNEAVGQAVQEAVRGVLVELLADAGLRAQLQSALGTPIPAVAPVVARPRSQAWDLCRRLWQALRERLHAFREALKSQVVQTAQACRQLWDRLTGLGANTCAWGCTVVIRAGHYLRLVRGIAIALLTALAVGGLVTTTSDMVGPWLAASLSGLCGFVTAFTVCLDGWLRRILFRASAPPA